jgi:hypothetical protein
VTRRLVALGLPSTVLAMVVGVAVYGLAAYPPAMARPANRMLAARSAVPPPFVIFRTLAPARAYGRVAMMPLRAGAEVRYLSGLSCARVHYAGGTGLCLVEEVRGSRVRYLAHLFDRTLAPGTPIELDGVPIRARVAPDGRRAALTVYAEVESPAGERLAMQTILVDVPARRVEADLRDFSLDSPTDRRLTDPIDVMSVAFADHDRFFATLVRRGEPMVVSGSVAGRRLTLVGEGMASEAVSPDGTRLLVKRRVGERGYWQLLVLELATMTTRSLNQGNRSVDDQVEWLDAGHVMYHDASDDGTAIWVLPIDGVSGPRVLVRDAFSPAVER